MWLDEIDEIFKGFLPYYILVFLPIFIIVSPVNPVNASHEFPIYRMQHFDLHGVSYGSRSSAVNLEAKSLSTWSAFRHCVMTRLTDLTVDAFRQIRSKAGALIIELPPNISTISQEQKQSIQLLEHKMLYEQEISIPVYFINYDPKIDEIISELSSSGEANEKSSAAQAMYSSIAANGYQIIIPSSNSKTNIKIPTLHGHLSGYRPQGKIPTVAIVTHYDSFGASPDLSFGADSNGSGVIVMLELIRLFSGLYKDPQTRGKYNILFVLAGGGKINYQGTKKWLEDQLDSSEGSLIQDASFVLCLDTLATSDTIYMHVSKPPKEGTPSSNFYKNLKSIGETHENVTIEGVHKKINLAEDLLGWEHERFSIRRLSAFTLSSIKSHKDPWRSTIIDAKDNVDVKRLQRNAEIIVDALGKFIYDTTDIFGAGWNVSGDAVESWMDYLSSQPRSPQLLTAKDHPLLVALQDDFNKYLRDVKVTYAVPDKRDPDYQFYSSTGGIMHIYSVKPALFDLVLTIAIAIYLSAVYFVINFVPTLYELSTNFMRTTTTTTTKIKIR
ncbi:nicalin-1 [Anthonomus grandis grandis]|uniref:nicalin-1 n=1 Tax=Anthonomus grandis grandis TaxID=2921223 RepID=UPI002165F131|nr:nicalin-1 [Anthonomus grandis grandis]